MLLFVCPKSGRQKIELLVVVLENSSIPLELANTFVKSTP
jgi:hypothetical protein